MIVELSIVGLSSLVLGAVGLFAALLLLSYDEGSHNGSVWISGFLTSLSLPMLIGFFDEAGWFGNPAVFFTLTIAAYFTGPTLYLYARQPWRQRLDRGDLIHCVSPAVGVLTTLHWYWNFDSANALALWVGPMYVASTGYAVATLRLLKRYRKALHDHFSDTYRLRLSWLRLSSWAVLALIGTDVLLGILLELQATGLKTARLSITLVLSLTISALSLSALRHPARYVAQIATNRPKTARYATSRASQATLDEWGQRLRTVMQDERPYLVNDLSLTDLAALLDITPHNLSQLLNCSLETTFYDFINEARVHHACGLLASTHETVLNIAFASGFNNKASFYSAFRHFMRTTPSAYRQAARRAEPSSVT